jgi:hypothetical protein
MNSITFEKSTRKHKKYKATVQVSPTKTLVIHFGDSRYQQYKDQTPLKLYKHLNHLNTERRKRYYQRHGLRAKKYSAKWFSHKYLW